MQLKQRTKRRIIMVVQSVLFVGLLLLYLSSILVMAQYAIRTDLGKFHASTQLLLQGKDIYTPLGWDYFGPLPEQLTEITRDTLHPNLNLPHITVLLAPLAFMDYSVVHWLWSVLSLMAGFVACVITWQAVSIGPRKDYVSLFWIWIVFLAYFPTFAAFTLGQLTLLLFLLTALVWRLTRSSAHAWLAGILLGLAFSLKLFLGALLLFYVVRRQWYVVVSAVITFAAALLIGVLVVDVEGFQSYFTIMRSITWFGSNWNASFASFFTRILGGSENVPGFDAPWLANLLTNIFSLASIVWAAMLAWPKELSGEDEIAQFDLSFGLMLVVMLLASPLGWMYYFPLLLIPGISSWSLTAYRFSRRYRSGIVVAWVLSTIPLILSPARTLNEPVAWFTWAAVYFYALLVAGWTLSTLLMHLRDGRHIDDVVSETPVSISS